MSRYFNTCYHLVSCQFNFYYLGDRWSRFQALKDPCCAQVRCSRAHRDGAEAEGELEEVLQEQKVQAPRPEAQEDPCHQEGAHPPREGTQDRQGAPS